MYHIDRLSNGLRIATCEMPGKDSVAIGIWVKVGSRYEPFSLNGISHFVEHMLFKGTAKRTTQEIKESIEGLGGVLNAFTSEELTCYFVKILKAHLHLTLDVLSDMIKNSMFKPEELEKERGVILEEIKMYLDLPSHHVHDLIGALLWPNQSLGRMISGDDKTVSKLTRSDLAGYVKKYYHPRNLLISVCGDVDHDEIYSQVDKFFPSKSGEDESVFKPAVVNQSKPKTLIVDRKTEQTHLVIGLHSYSRFHPNRYKASLLNIILGANMSSRLFEEVREKRGLAYEIRSQAGSYLDTGSFNISAGVETKKAPVAIRVILKELDKIRKKPVTEDELRRAKDYFMGQFYMGMEDTLDHMSWMGERVLLSGEMPGRGEIEQAVRKITCEDVLEVAREIFQSNHLNLALISSLTDKARGEIEKEFSNGLQ